MVAKTCSFLVSATVAALSQFDTAQNQFIKEIKENGYTDRKSVV